MPREVPGRAGVNKPASGFLVCCLQVVLLNLGVPSLLRPQGQVNGVVAGRVTDIRGQPQQVLVRLVSAGEILVDQVYTDASGAFAFGNLQAAVYYVRVEADGFRPASRRTEVFERNSTQSQVEIVLEPTDTPQHTPNAQVRSGSPGDYKLDITNQRRPFASKALREFAKGNEKKRSRDWKGAIAHYQNALRVEPSFYPALNNLGAIYEAQKDHAQAEAAFLKSLELNPEDGQAYINLGHVLYEEGQYRPAIARLEEGLKRFPGSPVAYFFLGCTYMKLGDAAKAEANLKEAFQLDPEGMASARLQLANLYLKRGETSAADLQLESYLKARPSDPQAPAIRKMLADIRSHPGN